VVLRTLSRALSLSHYGVVAALVLATAAGAAAVPLTKISATDETPIVSSGYPADKFGTSLAVSQSGSTAVVGGFGDDGGRGAVWFFDHDAAGWHQLPKLTNTATVGAAWFGDSVALSADGRTAIVGAPFDNVNVGSAWVYTRTGAGWQLQAKLTGSEPSSSVEDGFGIDVSLSADGNTALIGAYTYNGTRGAAFAFHRSGTTWTRLGSILTGVGEKVNGFYGSSVSLSSDGSVALIGAPDDNQGVGAAWVYMLSGSDWRQLGQKLLPRKPSGHPAFGCSVAVAGNGRTVVVGGCRDHGGIGAVWTFVRRADAFVSDGAKLLATHERGAGAFGYSVALSSNGRLAVVGMPDEAGGRGSVRTFVRSAAGPWRPSRVVGPQAGSLGFSVALDGAGRLVLAGAPNAEKSAGVVWAYTRSG
jgi:FG-GAP repeat